METKFPDFSVDFWTPPILCGTCLKYYSITLENQYILGRMQKILFSHGHQSFSVQDLTIVQLVLCFSVPHVPAFGPADTSAAPRTSSKTSVRSVSKSKHKPVHTGYYRIFTIFCLYLIKGSVWTCIPEAETIWELSSEVPKCPILIWTPSVVSGQGAGSAASVHCTEYGTCLLVQPSSSLKNELVWSGDGHEAS